jgi:DNA polymerase III subunit alpha
VTVIDNRWWSAHTHSRYSAGDALPTVKAIVDRAVELRYPVLGLTDHGNSAGTVELYTHARKAGIEPLPGMEAYVALNRNSLITLPSGRRKLPTFHMGLLATTEVGYRNLIGLHNTAHRNFTGKPVLDLGDFAKAHDDGLLEGVVATSGCWFGLLPTLMREGDPIALRNVLAALEGWFTDGFYIEMQHHGIHTHEQNSDLHVADLHTISKQMGLPVIIGQDSHYCHLEERPVHDALKMLSSWKLDDPDDAIFPGDGYHMADLPWIAKHYTPDQLEDGLAGLDDLASKAKVRIPELDTFKLAVPDTGGDPDAILMRKTTDALEARFADGRIRPARHSAYRKLLAEELDVVIGAGFSGYLLLAGKVADYMREEKISFSVRGSAAGALLCWLLGITNLDPVVWGLPFDRFLSRDRTKPPDIDFDIEHRRRDEVIDWLANQYHVVRIGTWGQLGINDDDDEEDQKGSLLVKWKQRARHMGMDPNAPVPPAEWAKLQALAQVNARTDPSHPGAYGGVGVHAAGVLITPDERTASGVPLVSVKATKEDTERRLVTAFYKDDLERMGLVKLDLLALRTQTAMRIVHDLVGLDVERIPLNDKDTYRSIRTGNTVGLFQLEGGAAARGVKQLAPTRIQDIIAAMALFRPAALNSGATESFLRRRNGQEPIPARHDIITAETKDTYGVIVYQEQALNIMKRLGLTVEEVEKARKAIKASNAGVGDAQVILRELQGKIAVQAQGVGMCVTDVAWLNEALDAYANYGFNKAHATAYGLLAYWTAYARTHHPVAFWAGILDCYADDNSKVWVGNRQSRTRVSKTDKYKVAARTAGLMLLPAHVNRSKENYTATADLKALRAGLSSVPGVGVKGATEIVAHAPYSSLDDFADRVSASRVGGVVELRKGHSPMACGGVVVELAKAGAFEGITFDPVRAAERDRLAAEKAAKKEAMLLKRWMTRAEKHVKARIKADAAAAGATLKRTEYAALWQAEMDEATAWVVNAAADLTAAGHTPVESDLWKTYYEGIGGEA